MPDFPLFNVRNLKRGWGVGGGGVFFWGGGGLGFFFGVARVGGSWGGGGVGGGRGGGFADDPGPCCAPLFDSPLSLSEKIKKKRRFFSFFHGGDSLSR